MAKTRYANGGRIADWKKDPRWTFQQGRHVTEDRWSKIDWSDYPKKDNNGSEQTKDSEGSME